MNRKDLETSLKASQAGELSLKEAIEIFNELTGSNFKRIGSKAETNQKVAKLIEERLAEDEPVSTGDDVEVPDTPKVDRRRGPRTEPRKKSWAPNAPEDYEFPEDAPKYNTQLHTITGFIKEVYSWSTAQRYVWPKTKFQSYLMEQTGSSKYSINSMAASSSVHASHKVPYMEMTVEVQAELLEKKD
ncbi:hypothetical protein [Endozoicomonas sp. ALB032]|uniref:hypothetical protein n=1 Tax=Endozoicomonas sp. ALB032 TaxID=3403082 RepID=UPI003BB6484D